MCARHVRETKVAGARVTMMAALFAFVAITRTRGGLKTPRRYARRRGRLGNYVRRELTRLPCTRKFLTVCLRGG